MPKTTYCNLTQLKHRLNIQPINTGRQFSLGGRSGIVTDDMEALHAKRSMSGDCINLMSGVEFSFTEYRGQTQEWVGMNSVITAGVELGPRTIVAAGAVVTKSFPEGFCVLAGVPAKVVKKLDKEKFIPWHAEEEWYGYYPKDKFEKVKHKYIDI